MAKLYFRYGTMNSAKTANLMMVAHNYMRQNKRVIILSPARDSRKDSALTIRSRAIAEPLPCFSIADTENIFDIIQHEHRDNKIYAVLVDEAQFFTAAHIKELTLVVDQLSIPVLCYGLRCSYMDGRLFEGSAALLYWADSIEEIKTTCEFCNKKATQNLLRINGIPQYGGESTTVMGDIEGVDLVFSSVCRIHYLNPPI